ncbi:unnamed protein product [Bemisia tabaci]|uniref:Uncharacterized protein n=1 Tax=Bemisia tabaci TaxID=7038 RepID=A0A9P0AFY2_BEMTA|nr:unnamed protein product [Bemisia tabaci]
MAFGACNPASSCRSDNWDSSPHNWIQGQILHHGTYHPCAKDSLDSSLRTTIITELESRHRSIIICLTLGSQLLVVFYFLPPVIALFFNPSPSRKLRLPMEMPDPLSLLGFASNDVTMSLIYLSFFASYLVHFYIIYVGAALQVTTVDSLKTAFCICGLSLGTLGHDKFSNWEQFVDAVKLHQRLFR